MKKILILLVIVLVAIPAACLHAQEKVDTIVKANDSTATKQKKVKPVPLTPIHRNVIKFNPTPMLIQMVEVNNVTFSYERMIKDNMSLCLQLGYLVFPNLIRDTVLNLVYIQKGKKNGINVAFDYRYYPFSRNRRPAPDGLYIGGYTSYYGFSFDNDFNILNDSLVQNGRISGKLNVVNLGFELGYQFIFWKRLTLDLLLFGPALSMMKGNISIGGNLDPEQIKDIDSELAQKLLDRFPTLNALVKGEDLKFTGSKTSFGTGFRYSIQIGFHF